MKKIGVLIFKSFSWLLSIAPRFVLYGLADIVFIVLYYILGYRKKVVYQNLKNSFPEKTEKEIKSIQRKFFHHLSDIFIENIALIKMKPDRIRKMVEFENPEIITDLYKKNKSIVGITGHYGNWEIFIALPFFTQHLTLCVYKPLNSKFFDREFYKMRAKLGEVPVTMRDAYRTVLKYNRDNQLTILGLIADQRPPRISGNYWTMFLNQETPVFLGPEKIARKLNASVIYTHVDKVKRGKYVLKATLLFEEAANCDEYEITRTHLRLLENYIKEKPEYWLWSHKRWKHKRDPETPIHE
ncbi:MAG: lysophospholipid acyltransferase family protein [Bacteroidetes bacterium]|nr:lysophospholipid acyltransferase family protein [Bacteroidota bacterium]